MLAGTAGGLGLGALVGALLARKKVKEQEKQRLEKKSSVQLSAPMLKGFADELASCTRV